MRNVLDGMEQLTRMGAKRQGIWVKPKRLPRAFNMLLATCCRKPGELSSRSTNRTAVYGPVRTVVWEGSDREVAPYPDYMLLSFFFSGHMFPLDMLPGVMGTIVKLTPFPYLAYFPAALFVGKIQGAALVKGLSVQLFWVLFFIVVSRLAFFYGTKRYSGYGG